MEYSEMTQYNFPIQISGVMICLEKLTIIIVKNMIGLSLIEVLLFPKFEN